MLTTKPDIHGFTSLRPKITAWLFKPLRISKPLLKSSLVTRLNVFAMTIAKANTTISILRDILYKKAFYINPQPYIPRTKTEFLNTRFVQSVI